MNEKLEDLQEILSKIKCMKYIARGVVRSKVGELEEVVQGEINEHIRMQRQFRERLTG